MGADYLEQQHFAHTVLGGYEGVSNARDSVAATRAFIQKGVDLLVFVGGDGTARDVLSAATDAISCLGLPAGVKMHSGVFAISPMAAARLVTDLVVGRIISRQRREVRDYIEAKEGAVPNTVIRTRAYGELWVPEANDLLQQTKVGGKENEVLAVMDIVSYVTESWAEATAEALIVGPGSTCMQIKQALGMPATLLGFDVLLPDGNYVTDATADQLLPVVRTYTANVVLSFTRQQAFLLGRGNQQLSPEVLSHLHWPRDFIVVSSRSKLLALEQRPLLVDSDDAAFDAKCRGLVEVITGYDERLLYRVASPA
jgi:predicted polyphosphate/ATP-dependent NAD kinase